MTRLINAEAIQYSSDISDTIKPDDLYHFTVKELPTNYLHALR